MGFLANIFGQIIALIYNLVQNYGLSIVFFAIISRALLIPFYIKQQKSSQVMMAIQPKIKQIQKKYAADQMTMNKKLSDLYREHGYNPLSGCLPSIIQIILVLGMFTALRKPEIHVFTDPEVLRVATSQHFLWIPDLSQPDLLSNVISTNLLPFAEKLPGLMPIISSVLTFLSMHFMPTPGAPQGDDPAANPMGGMTKVMKILFPVLILVYGVSFTGGIIVYWTVGTIFSLVQQIVVGNMLKRKQEETIN